MIEITIVGALFSCTALLIISLAGVDELLSDHGSFPHIAYYTFILGIIVFLIGMIILCRGWIVEMYKESKTHTFEEER